MQHCSIFDILYSFLKTTSVTSHTLKNKCGIWQILPFMKESINLQFEDSSLFLYWKVCLWSMNLFSQTCSRGLQPGGALQYQMDTGVRLTLPKAGAFGENTVSKNEGSLSEKPNLGSNKLGGIGWECYIWSFSEHFKSRNLHKRTNKQKIVQNGKNDQFVKEIETKSSFMWQPNAKNKGSLGESD